ncbi:MAG TPA: sterol desaturase family protein [Myxococcota bacterium]|jgi:hypothetical protein|nr:sterol desaturase family protein [Myxococcota bacterium]
MASSASIASIPHETKLDPASRDALRATLVARIPRWYSPWAHLACPSVVGLGLIVVAVLLLRDVRWWDLLVVPLTFVASNVTEWRTHRYVLHRRSRFVELLYDRHTPEHHRVFITEDMAMRSTREFRLVLIPAYGILVTFLVTLPLAALAWWAGLHNGAALYVATTMGYVVSYEWLHLAYHLPPDSGLGRLWLVRVLRRHHATHHDPALMQRWNFNVTIPLWDWVRGTTWKG